MPAICVLLFMGLFPLCAQDDKEAFENLQLQIQLQQSLEGLSARAKSLIDSAEAYEARQDYLLATIFLQQALEENAPQVQTGKPAVPPTQSPWSLAFKSGVDYNRQEFELGFEQSDSVLLDEIHKPFIGLTASYRQQDSPFSLYNDIRYDKENLSNRFSAGLRWQSPNLHAGVKASHILDRNFTYENQCYNEVNVDADADLRVAGSRFSLSNITRIKSYKSPSSTLPDFRRNTMYALASHSPGQGHTLEATYDWDYLRGIDRSTNDQDERQAALGYHFLDFSRLQADMRFFYRTNRFNYLLGDSVFQNSSFVRGAEPYLKWRLSSSWSVSMSYSGQFKTFGKKTEQDADYTWHTLHPRLYYDLSEMTVLSTGYIYEERTHETSAGLQDQYILEQDYFANGFSVGVDHSSLSGFILSAELSYTARRYPQASGQDVLSIYSSRNIITLLAFGHLPLSDRWSIDLLASYDNDKDIDNDSNDVVSSFFSLEIQYHLK